MDVVSSILTGGVGNLLGGIGQLAKDIREAVTGENPELELKLAELEAQAAKAQAEINKIEAQHPSVFVAGWRPFIGWVCGAAIAWHFIGHSFAVWLITMFRPGMPLPPMIPVEGLYPVVMTMLGFGAFRSWEKLKGIQWRH